MKSIIAFSDVHGNIDALNKLIPRLDEADYVFFLGDGLADIKSWAIGNKDKVFCVKGNRDVLTFSKVQDEIIVEIENLKLFLTHGHKYRVEQTLLNLGMEAEAQGCAAAFYGHSHAADINEYNGVKLINGGAFYNPARGVCSYAYVTIHGGKVIAKIVELS